MIDWSDPKLWVACYGAALSSLLAIREIRKSRRSVHVNLSWSYAPTPQGTLRLVTVTAVNRGHRPIVIENAGLMTKRKRRMIQHVSPFGGRWPLPKRLEDGEPVEVQMELAEVQRMIGDVRKKDPGDKIKWVYVLDAENKTHKRRIHRNSIRELNAP